MQVRWGGWGERLSDLDYIRALLVAQTAEPEPKSKGGFGAVLGGLFARKAEAPPARPLHLPAAEPTPAAPTEPELLLEHTLRPPLEVEAASPLSPPTPRQAFGRRPDMAPEPELILDQPASEARRLQLLDPSGQPVGEMILHPDEAPLRVIPTLVYETPYFPEDLLDHGPEPLRPWLKALRNSGRPSPPPETEASSVRAAPARRTGRRPSAPRPTPPAHPLGHDLLEALAVALAREQETLSDRLLELAARGLMEALAESAAA